MRVWLGGALSLVAMTANAAALRDFRLTQGPESTRVVLDLGKPGTYNVFTLANPDRVVIDLPSVQKPGDVLKLSAQPGMVKGVRSGPHEGGLRVVLDTSSAVTPKAFGMPPAGGYGYRLIVDLLPPVAAAAPVLPAAPPVASAPASTSVPATTVPATAESAPSTLASTVPAPAAPSQAPAVAASATPPASLPAASGLPTTTAVAQAPAPPPVTSSAATNPPAPVPATVAAAVVEKPVTRSATQTAPSSSTTRSATALRAKPIVVAVDAGHGGEDPGAHGPHGLLEKDVTLSIARKLARLIDSQPGMHAVLTRDSDTYVDLRERTIKARDAQADLFVSVHCNALRDPHMRGTAVYVLSDHGATNEQARWLANRENAADLVGGVDLHDKDNQVAAVLIDISQTATMEASFDLGSRMLDSLARINVLQKPKVQQAGFMVLKSPDIPSVLVETAFITNDREERMLGSSSYQDKFASSLLDGIRGYFSHYRPQQQIVADDDQEDVRPRAIPVSMASASGSAAGALHSSAMRGN